MKKTALSLMLLVGLFLANLPLNQLHADNIDVVKAKQLGAYYMGVESGKTSLSANDLDLVYQIDNTTLNIPALYIFNTSNNGFVIVAGSDCTDPIIAYSTEGTLDPNRIPTNMLWFLNSYVQGIVVAQNNNLTPTPDVKKAVDDLVYQRLDANQPKQIYKTLTSQWDQGYPYNSACPVIDGEQCVTGCVATAAAQIIHYWRYPLVPAGNVTYSSHGIQISEIFKNYTFNYDLMPDVFNNNWSADEISATGTLNYLCGVANRMGYGVDASGAHSSMYTKNAFKSNFKYDKNTIKEYDRTKAPFNCSANTLSAGDTMWVDSCIREIKAKRPIFYTGDDLSSSGEHAAHAWVCDGYNSSNKKLHMNWGWGGMGDSYFNVYTSHLNAAGYNFSSTHWMITGITPPADSLPVVGINEVNSDNEFVPAFPNPATSSITIPYHTNGSAMLQVISVDGRTIESRQVEGEGAVVLNVRNWSKGVYIYRINGDAHKFVVR